MAGAWQARSDLYVKSACHREKAVWAQVRGWIGVPVLFSREVKGLWIRGLPRRGEVELAEGLNLGVKGGQEPRAVLWFSA